MIEHFNKIIKINKTNNKINIIQVLQIWFKEPINNKTKNTNNIHKAQDNNINKTNTNIIIQPKTVHYHE